MSFIFNNKIRYSDSPNLDAFGRLRVAETTNSLDLKHVANKLPLFVSEVTGGTATSIFSQENARVRMSTSNSGDYVVRKSKVHPIYQAGKSQLFEASFSNLAIETNVIKRVGGFTSTTAATYNSLFDGYFLESNGITNEIGFFIYKNGTNIFSASTSSWNNNEFDVNNIDWTKTNLMVVDYQWLGVGRMRFGMVLSGLTYYFTDYSAAGNLDTVYMSSPSQPIRYEIRQQGVGSGTFDMICSQVSVEGSLNNLFSSIGNSHSATTTLTTSGVKYPYIGVRLKSEYKAALVELLDAYIMNTSNDNYIVTIEINPTLSSTATWVSSGDLSPVEYSLGDGSITVSRSNYILTSVLGEAGTSTATKLEYRNNQIKLGTNVDGSVDEGWICITPLGANATFIGSANLLYYI